MYEINWSEAPEGATHYNRECTNKWLRDGTYPAFFVEGYWKAYGVGSIGKRHIAEAVAIPKKRTYVVALTETEMKALLILAGQCAGDNGSHGAYWKLREIAPELSYSVAHLWAVPVQYGENHTLELPEKI